MTATKYKEEPYKGFGGLTRETFPLAAIRSKSPMSSSRSMLCMMDSLENRGLISWT
jgi:hypothetical protein